MRNLWRVVFGILVAALTAPLGGWALACSLDRAGVTAASRPVASWLFQSLPFASGSTSDDPTVPFWCGVAAFALLALGGGWVLAHVSVKKSWGLPAVAAILVAATSVYLWLGWDEPPVRTEPERLRPSAAVSREPRELFLEATGGSAFGQPPGWPGSLVSRDAEPPSEDWLRIHAGEIRAKWELIRPVRDWVRKVNGYDGFDDYAEKFESPLLKFQPIRHFYFASRDMALLAAADGKFEEAAAITSETLTLACRLRSGSRCLVDLMIGTVLEKSALRTLRVLISRHPQSVACLQQSGILARLQPSDWDDLDRVLLNEVSFFLQRFPAGSGYPGAGRAMRATAVWWVMFRPNATARMYHDYLMEISAAARRGDLGRIQAIEEQHDSQRKRLRFRNGVGYLLFDELPPPLWKIVRNLNEAIELRAQLVRTLRAET